MNDAISRSAVLTVGNVRKVTEYDEAGYDMTYDAVPVEAIEALPVLDVAPVVHRDFASVLTVKNVNEWHRRIILDEGEKSKNCAVYYKESDFDLAPVVHARWIRDYLMNARCSNCHTRLPFRHCYDEENGYEWDDEIDVTPWCMYCGARMDGEESEEAHDG